MNLDIVNASVEYDITQLYKIIFDIIDMHKEFNEYSLFEEQINLKTTQVKEVLKKVEGTKTYLIDQEFYELLSDYIFQLDILLAIEVDFEYTYTNLDSRVRVKQLESIIYKLSHYKFGKREQGAIPLKKCLNDLFGFRICLPNFKHDCEKFAKMCKHIEETYKIKYINASKGNYKATHIYFYGANNKIFPWELQIWLPEDHESNYESHEKHKQEYKKSAEVHKDGFYLKEV